MRQIGIVKSLQGNRATISVSRKTACEGCAAKSGEGGCSGCMTLATNRELVAAADNRGIAENIQQLHDFSKIDMTVHRRP